MGELMPDVREDLEEARDEGRRVMDPAMAKVLFANDLDDDQFRWCVERLVPEAERLTTEPVDLSGLQSGPPRTWVRTMRDAILTPEMQLRFAARIGEHTQIDLDAGHMCMIGRSEELAGLLNRIASTNDGRTHEQG